MQVPPWISNIPRYLAVFIAASIFPLPRYPVHVADLCDFGHCQLDISTWHRSLLDHWLRTSLRKLERMEFCKGQKDKLGSHFLVFRFSASATVIVDCTAGEVSPTTPGSPGQHAVDSVHVVGKKEVETWLTKTYGKYEVLCALEYTSSDTPQSPSVAQLSTLVVTVHQHFLDSHLHAYYCHCFPQIVFKACKELFPGSQECRYRDLADGHCSISNDLHLILSVCLMDLDGWMQLEAQRRACAEEHRALEETLKRLGEECRKLEGLNKALESSREQRTVP